MKLFKKSVISNGIVILLLALACIESFPSQAQEIRYTNPVWAPAYYPGVRYYYLPDIEAYYDLSNRDFVYLDDGQWLFSYGLPPMYSGYDLYDAFIVALDLSVFQPWLHHQFYVSNYPRYYYRSLYKDSERANMRGFNENGEKPISWNQADRAKTNELRKSAKTEIKSGISRPAQRSNYYGKNIGQHVKVQRQMREQGQRNQSRRKR